MITTYFYSERTIPFRYKRFNLWPFRLALKFKDGYIIVVIGKKKVRREHGNRNSD